MTWGKLPKLSHYFNPSLQEAKSIRTTIPSHSAIMVLAKSKKSVGLGNSLMNDRFGKGKNSEMHRGNAKDQGIQRTGADGMTVSITIYNI